MTPTENGQISGGEALHPGYVRPLTVKGSTPRCTHSDEFPVVQR